ncbi:MAG: 2OG-Fe(II) oxygenase [Henriciella sp.]|nr:2OG-Fe(II) oxygenase [Henriciella sp.]
MSLTNIRLNPDLDPDALAAIYARDKFIQIPGIFHPETADEIAAVLRQKMPWRLIYADPDTGIVEITRAEAEKLGAEDMQKRMAGVMQRATRNYGYCYNGYHMTNARRDGLDDGHPIHRLTDFLNSRTFLDFGAQVIGRKDITQLEAQATLFTHGSFLTRHIDDGSQNERRAAYTLSFCPNWQTDWGGLLQLINQQTTDVISAWVPRFNMLSIFDGTQVHAVSPVSNFAGDGRYSIVGWLRNDPVA